MAEKNTIERIEQIEAQLSMLQTSYGGILRTYYNMFYNNSPMDVQISIYNDNGALETILVPNRAKFLEGCISGKGSPEGSVEQGLGTFYVDEITKNLYFKTTSRGTDGWQLIYTTSNFIDGNQFLAPNGSGSLLEDIDAEKITLNKLAVTNGGTGRAELHGILKGNGTDPIEMAVEGVDYMAPADLSGMVVYVLSPQAPAGFLPCNGALVSKKTYARLYEQIGTMYGESEDGEKFALPNLNGLFIRCWTGESNSYDTEENRKHASIQGDCVPNIKATWAQEITGAEPSFAGSVSIALDEEGRYVQVDGKTSAPGGSYDYLIEFDASKSSDKYRDVDEVRVKNIALLPVIKY